MPDGFQQLNDLFHAFLQHLQWFAQKILQQRQHLKHQSMNLRKKSLKAFIGDHFVNYSKR